LITLGFWVPGSPGAGVAAVATLAAASIANARANPIIVRNLISLLLAL
jgi:hypothetical protein